MYLHTSFELFKCPPGMIWYATRRSEKLQYGDEPENEAPDETEHLIYSPDTL